MTARRGPRDLSPALLLDAALAVREERGEAGFSLRRVAAAVGCDPMTVSYHFGSREGLDRALAHRLDEQVRAGDPDAPWRERLAHLAREYRAVALAHPQTFPLLQRFAHSGPADHAHGETVHGALVEAGVPEPLVPSIATGWYACVIGLAVGETSGLVAPVSDAEAAELEVLPGEAFALTRRLVPAYRALSPGDVVERTLDLLADGIAAYGAQASR